MDCPRCGLDNPDIAMRCDCGYDFDAKAMRGSLLTAQSATAEGKPPLAWLVTGWLLVVFGSLLGIGMGLHLALAQDRAIRTKFRYDVETRQTGWGMVVVGCLIGAAQIALIWAR